MSAAGIRAGSGAVAERRHADSVARRPWGYYRSFESKRSADEYDEEVYAPDSYYSWVWELEKEHLRRVVGHWFDGGPARYLDFACGSGRVLSALEPYAGDASGVDISEPMLARASRKGVKANLILGDPVGNPSLLDGPYDLITAFRFLLHAESHLRHGALQRIRAALSDDGVFVFNVHGNKHSLRCAGVTLRRVLLRQKHNQLSYREVKRLLDEHDFEVVGFRGFGLAVPRLYNAAPRLARRMEALVNRVPALGYVASDMVFVCKKR